MDYLDPLDVDPLDHFVCTIVRTGSPLEIVDLNSRISDSLLLSLSVCTTLQSLYLESAFDEQLVEKILSKNLRISSLQLTYPDPPSTKAIVKRILSAKRNREETDQNLDDADIISVFFSSNLFEHFRVISGFNQRFGIRVQFLREIELTAIFQPKRPMKVCTSCFQFVHFSEK